MGRDSPESSGEGLLEPLLSFAEVRDLLRISDASLYRLIARGELPVVEIGGRRTLFERAGARRI